MFYLQYNNRKLNIYVVSARYFTCFTKICHVNLGVYFQNKDIFFCEFKLSGPISSWVAFLKFLNGICYSRSSVDVAVDLSNKKAVNFKMSNHIAAFHRPEKPNFALLANSKHFHSSPILLHILSLFQIHKITVSINGGWAVIIKSRCSK